MLVKRCIYKDDYKFIRVKHIEHSGTICHEQLRCRFSSIDGECKLDDQYLRRLCINLCPVDGCKDYNYIPADQTRYVRKTK